MWRVFESRRAARAVDRAPNEIVRKYEFWKSVVELDGPAALQKLPGLRDHALKGEWSGARSSSLSYQWRVIYASYEENRNVMVLEVNAHDYRKKG